MQTQKQLEARMAMERKVIRHLIRTAKRHGYALTKASDGEVVHKVSTEAAAMDVVFSVDEAWLYFKHPAQPKGHSVFIVLGNDGWDAINDHSVGEGGDPWETAMEECNAYSDKLCEQTA